MNDRSSAPSVAARRGTRRDELLRTAAQLFAERGFGGTSIDDIGAAVGVSGPAIYWHFAGKEALLAEMLTDISDRLLAQGAHCVEAATDPADALERLLRAHIDFALDNPALITVHGRELANLADDARRRVRRTQRRYVEEWVTVLAELFPEVNDALLRAAVHAAIGLINSTPYLEPVHDRAAVAELLHAMARAALTAPWSAAPA